MWEGVQGFQFGAKKKNSAVPAIVDRFLSGTIARQVKSALLAIPESEGEHANKFFKSRRDSIFAEGGKHHFGIGMAAEFAAGSFEIRFDIVEIVDFAVINENITAI